MKHKLPLFENYKIRRHFDEKTLLSIDHSNTAKAPPVPSSRADTSPTKCVREM